MKTQVSAEEEVRNTVSAIRLAAEGAGVSRDVMMSECRKHIVLLMRQGMDHAAETNPTATEEDMKEAKRRLYVLVAEAFEKEFGEPF